MRTHLELLVRDIPYRWKKSFLDFHEIYFQEYVKAGILLEDVSYKNLSYDGRRRITNMAYNLWISENWDVVNGKLVGIRVDSRIIS